jgi:hypothetical protein
MFIDRETREERGTPLGVRCFAEQIPKNAFDVRAVQIQKPPLHNEHCTPKGVDASSIVRDL